MHVMRYLQGTKSKGLVLGASTDPLMGWTDADFAGCKDTRKSRGGYVYCLHGSAVSWCSKLQTCVALSTAESEYMASSAATREGVWLQRICMDLGMPSGPFVLHMDNQAAKFMATNGAVSARTKHIAVPFHFVKDSVLRGVVQLQFVGSRDLTIWLMCSPSHWQELMWTGWLGSLDSSSKAACVGVLNWGVTDTCTGTCHDGMHHACMCAISSPIEFSVFPVLHVPCKHSSRNLMVKEVH